MKPLIKRSDWSETLKYGIRLDFECHINSSSLSLTLTQLKQAGRQYSWTEKSQKDRATEGEIKKQ